MFAYGNDRLFFANEVTESKTICNYQSQVDCFAGARKDLMPD